MKKTTLFSLCLWVALQTVSLKAQNNLDVQLKTDRVSYSPSHTVTFTVTEGQVPSGAMIRYRQGATIVKEEKFTSNSWTWQVPSSDFKGYLVELYTKVNNSEKILGTIAVDVSSDWTRFPRYGFVADFEEYGNTQQKYDAIDTQMAFLNRCHINGVQFQDWQWKHHKPVCFDSDGKPKQWYQDISNRYVGRDIIRRYISVQHSYGMKSIFYNLCFGAWKDANQDGVSSDWALCVKNSDGSLSQDYHGLPSSWQSNIYLENPANASWQNYLCDRNAEVYANYDFDGYQIDQLGNRSYRSADGKVYDRQGREVDLPSAYASFIQAVKARHPQKNIIMNAVSSYGAQQIVGSGQVDFCYNEVWGGSDAYGAVAEDQFANLYEIIKNNDRFSNYSLRTVFAAYMNYAKADNGGSGDKMMNTPGVLLTDAVMFALGGSHLELGDHMLSREYFPAAPLAMSDELKTAIVHYYDFMTAYQNLLRGKSSQNDFAAQVKSSVANVSVCAWPPQTNKVVTFAKNVDNAQVIHLLNFQGTDDLSWRDLNGTRKEPILTQSLPLSVKSDRKITKVWVATPDLNGGAVKELNFSQVGENVSFTLPYLKYWTMVVLESDNQATAEPTVEENATANEKAMVISGKARFTVLTPEMIRVEYSDKGVFEDHATFTVLNRKLEVPSFTKTEDANFLYINTDKLSLKYRKGTDPRTVPASANNLTIQLKESGQKWYPGKPDPLNLKGTCRTLDGLTGDDKRKEMESGLISRSGWAVVDDSWTNPRTDGGRSYALVPNKEVGFDWWAERQDPHAMDTYFLGYGHDYKKAIGDYTHIAGKIPLPPKYVFGYWYSKYASYSADDYRNIMKDLKDNHVPADVMVLDMDWHWNGSGDSQSSGRGGWTGWSWNTNLIPNPQSLLQEIHSNGLKTSLNLHPADGINRVESPQYYSIMNAELGGKYLSDNQENIKWSLDYTDFTNALFKTIIRPHESEGVDFWWLDWQQYLTSPYTNSLSETFWCNHVFFNEAKKRAGRRPVIFHRWGGLGSHRYQIGFSGDANISYDALAFEPYFTATASNVGYGYWGHDLGGHLFTTESLANDPNLLLRWLQFGVFTPIFRTHATKDSRVERRIWKFSNFPLLLDAVRLRYTLFPYIYTMARKTYDTGISMCRPLYYDYPEDNESYQYDGEYFFGDDILVAPITTADVNGKATKEIWFPAGQWWSVSTHEMIEGPVKKTMAFSDNQIPYFYRCGAIIPCNPASVMSVTECPDELVLHIVSAKGGHGSLYEDAGDNADYATRYAVTDLEQTATGKNAVYTIHARKGSADGLPTSRSYTFNIHHSSRPVSVLVNGTSTAFSYDENTHCTTFKTPKLACDAQQVIEVKYTEEVTSVKGLNLEQSKVYYDSDTQQLIGTFPTYKQDISLSVCDAAGVRHLSRNFEGQKKFSQDVSMLSPQMYIMNVVADKDSYIYKFMKR